MKAFILFFEETVMQEKKNGSQNRPNLSS